MLSKIKKLKIALQKSPIPKTHAFVVQVLRQTIFDPNWHFHPEYQLFMVLNGTGTRFIGDHVKSFQAGDITFLGPNLPHLWRSDNLEMPKGNVNCAEGIVIYFNENFIGDTLLDKEEGILLRKLFRKSLRGVDVTRDAANEISTMILNLPNLGGFDAVLGLMHILNKLSQTDNLVPLASVGYTNSLRVGDTERMNKVYAYVLKNFQRKITITELAALTNMTQTSFSRYFKIHANKTFSEFVSEIRIGHACKLLIENKMNASRAGYESGFRTMSNFNRQFKAITNTTPLDYKRRYEMTKSD